MDDMVFRKARGKMKPIGALALAVFFLLELGAFAAFGYWGYHVHSGAVGFLLAIVMPVALAVLWALFLAPKASLPVFSLRRRTGLKALVFVAAWAALYVAGCGTLAVVYLVLSILVVATVFIMDLHDAAIRSSR